MRSLRSRLTVGLLGALALVAAAGGWLLAARLAAALTAEFDRALEAKARALVTLTKQAGDEVELDFADEFMPEFESAADPQYFEVWVEGDRLERSRSFRASEATRGAALLREQGLAPVARFRDLTLPDGRPGRQVQLDFVPQVEDEGAGEEAVELALDPRRLPAGSPRRAATVLVARERLGLDRRLSRLEGSVALFALGLLATAALLVEVVLALGLRPLDRLARQVEGLSAASLDVRVALSEAPRELAPVVDGLNALLTRLERAFRRERQLTADIAHELRTPIAELRNLAVVGGRWPEDRETVEAFFADARAIALQMEGIVSHLIAAARHEAGQEPALERLPVAVGPAVEAAWHPLAGAALAHGIELANGVGPEAAWETDAAALHLVLSNLLANAIAHGEARGRVLCRWEEAGGATALSIANPAPALEPGDLDVMFDRFWRKDPARAGGRHAGLGLALVRSLCERLELAVEAELTAGQLVIRLRRPAPPPS